MPWINASAVPFSGAKAYFFDSGTTTPRTTYQDSALTTPHDHPIVADSSGSFPAVFLQQGDYHLRILKSDNTTLHDVDGITAPVESTIIDGGGSTDAKLLKQTGEYGFFHSTGAVSGYVRANGRTIGNAASGATERANADCEDLFLFLWDGDSTLAVSGGRGASASSDWAASKTIALPDARSRTLIGLATMGNTDVALIDASFVDGGEDADTLGATLGVGDVTLVEAELPAHSHTGTTETENQSHTHNITAPGGTGVASGGFTSYAGAGTQTITTAGPNTGHDHDFTTDTTGSDTAHNNAQPSLVVGVYIKL